RRAAPVTAEPPAPAAAPARGDRDRPGRGRYSRRNRGERFMVPKAEFQSYYGRPIIKEPVWEVPDVPGYLFFGGLAGASSVLAAGAPLTSRPGPARATKLAALGGISVSTVFLIHDLGRPARFHHMLRGFKLSSPMSVGSWILSAYGPIGGAVAAADLAKLLPAGPSASRPLRAAAALARLAGPPATAVAALLGPAVAT